MTRVKNKAKKTKVEALQDIVNDYIAEGQPWPVGKRAIARWAVSRKRYQFATKTMVDRCAEELAEAMRQEMEVDPQGRTVRAKHCAIILEQDELGRKVQKHLWFDRDAATPDLMRRSLQQRRKGVLGDVKQLKTDRDSYNDNNRDGAYIQMSFNFEKDLEEMSQDSEYNPPAPESD